MGKKMKNLTIIKHSLRNLNQNAPQTTLFKKFLHAIACEMKI